jgi:Photosynthetic reaction centre cytochrome C subunit
MAMQKSLRLIPKTNLVALVVGVMLLCVAFVGRSGAQGQASTSEQAGPPQETFAKKDDVRPAEQVYKNIQVLKGVPADEVLDRMKFFTIELGVRCEFCHVTAEGSKIPGFGAFSKDDIDAKKTARKMIQMVGTIKTNFFDGKESPTCWTCHRGNKTPELEPAAQIKP